MTAMRQTAMRQTAMRQIAALTAALVLLVIWRGPALSQPLSDSDVRALSFQLVERNRKTRAEAARALGARAQSDAIAALVLAARYSGGEEAILEALTTLTGQPIANWKEAMEWQEAHGEIVPHQSFRDMKLALYEDIDPAFMRFLGGSRSKRENMRIRLEEIAWGGVPVDGIPALDDPELIDAVEADYLRADDLVFGVEINGDARAYPLRIMGWHEMFNETIGGVPVALAYCTLCGSGILFETQVEGRDKPFVFGSSGLLYRSNKLMFDRDSDSLWNQFTGEPVVGPLVDSGLRLKVRPVVITTWGEWMRDHRDTRVLSLETGYARDYRSGVVYADYFASPDLMFPALVRDESRVKRKDYVFGLRDVGASKAWPLAMFDPPAVINDAVGGRDVVLIGDAAQRAVRAYERDGRSFVAAGAGTLRAGDGSTWTIGEAGLEGPGGGRLARLPGHISYWFAWDSYFGATSALAGE